MSYEMRFFCLLLIVRFAIALNCEEYGICLQELKEFTQAKEFKIYQDKKEIQSVCRQAKGYTECVSKLSKKCDVIEDEAELSPLLRGAKRLLRDFCGHKSGLIRDYLKHVNCFENVVTEMNECNKKYRASLEMILSGSTPTVHQNEERYCSIKWFSKCIYDVVFEECGKDAARTMKSYVTKATQHNRKFYMPNTRCKGDLLGYKELPERFCERERFDHCFKTMHFSAESKRRKSEQNSEEKYLSVCSQIQNSFECLERIFRSCLQNTYFERFEKLDDDDDESSREVNYVCPVNSRIFPDYLENSKCLSTNKNKFLECRNVFHDPSNFATHMVNTEKLNRYFCSLMNDLKECLLVTVETECGSQGEKVVNEMINLSAKKVLLKCQV